MFIKETCGTHKQPNTHWCIATWSEEKKRKNLRDIKISWKPFGDKSIWNIIVYGIFLNFPCFFLSSLSCISVSAITGLSANIYFWLHWHGLTNHLMYFCWLVIESYISSIAKNILRKKKIKFNLIEFMIIFSLLLVLKILNLWQDNSWKAYFANKKM